MQYTLVGVYPDELSGSRELDVEPATYVEWVEAGSVAQAKVMAQEVSTDRADAVVVAVFEGHHIDRLFNKGTEGKD